MQKNIIDQLGIRVLSDKVLLEVNKEETRTDSGFIINNINELVKLGIVVAVGKGKRNEKGEYIPVDLEVGNEVTFQYGTEIKIEGKPYTFIAEGDVITVRGK